MLKNIETHDKAIIQKMAQLPIDIAAEVLTVYCNKTNRQCVLVGSGDNEEPCPFITTLCTDITADMWKEYLNE
mgnify:CR=1 FL=1|jgi:hypothetical protein